ncbi:MAG TPA: porin [Candidatus Binatia bacterium]|nr:porin [Candidatus Binatia bacterium]
MKTVIAAIVALAGATPALAGDAATTQSLDQRLKVIERQLEIQQEDAQARARETPGTTAGEKGFGFKSAKGDFEIRFKTLLQADGRFYTGDLSGQNFRDSFLLRRAETGFDGSLGKLVGFRLMAQLAPNSSGAAGPLDDWLELRFHPAATIRVGRFKEPVGIETLQSSAALVFIERGLPSELTPSRDFGAQLQGGVFDSALIYAFGVFNGVADGRDAASSDADNRKELAGRIFSEPFRSSPGFLQGLGFGIGGSTGSRLPVAATNAFTSANNSTDPPTFTFTATGDASNSQLPTFRSPGQQNFFAYRSTGTGATTAAAGANVVQANGTFSRWSPQLYYYRYGFGLLGEYVESEHTVQTSAVKPTRLRHKAYQGVASYVLGGDAAYTGVKPAHPYQPGADGWGALEIAARYAVLDVDDRAFPTFADPATQATKATDWGAALNWHLTPNVRIGANYDLTRFGGGAGVTAAPLDRRQERAIFLRTQISF